MQIEPLPIPSRRPPVAPPREPEVAARPSRRTAVDPTWDFVLMVATAALVGAGALLESAGDFTGPLLAVSGAALLVVLVARRR